MSKKPVKILASALVLAAAFGYLFVTSMSGNLEYYKTADEVAAEMDRWVGTPLRLAGTVQEGSIFNRPGTHQYVFTVESEGAKVPVLYSGPVPDSFAENVEVVVSGRLRSDGHFEGERVFARCPSKYEAAPRPQSGSGGHPDAIPIR